MVPVKPPLALALNETMNPVLTVKVTWSGTVPRSVTATTTDDVPEKPSPSVAVTVTV